MTFATHYNVGTVTVTAGSPAVVGISTFWSGNVQPGDILWVNGVCCRILAVNSNTSLTLARNWPGATAAGAYYEAWAVLDAVGYQKKTGELLTKLSGGNLDAFAGLSGIADRLAYFNGAGTMALTPFTAFDRSLLGNANATAFWNSVGATAPADKAFRRGNVIDTVSQSGGVPTGGLIEKGSNANGEYVRFADGTQICWGTAATSLNIDTPYGSALFRSAITPWTFPAAFAGTALVSAGSNSAIIFATTRQVNVTSAEGALYYFNGSLTARPLYMSAIGRWY
jgi:hypothetical protein